MNLHHYQVPHPQISILPSNVEGVKDSLDDSVSSSPSTANNSFVSDALFDTAIVEQSINLTEEPIVPAVVSRSKPSFTYVPDSFPAPRVISSSIDEGNILSH